MIGEPQRAFYGNQFGLTFPVFVHYGVALWVPEIGGPIDPDSEAHDLIMSVPIFHPDQIEHSLTTLETARPDNTPALGSARRELAQLDKKMARYREALEAGTDPILVAEWTTDVQRKRQLATDRIIALQADEQSNRTLTRAEIETLIESLGGMADILGRADASEKLELYRQLGLKLTYDHTARSVVAEVDPQPPVGVVVVSEGGLEPPRPLKGTSTSS